MKKLFLGALALMIGAIGFAQNTGTIYQVGTLNDANVDQIGSLNNATVDQYGKNFADVYQKGTDNFADVDQGTALASKTNVALVGYYGGGSWVSQLGDRNRATVAVTGNSVGSRVDQKGNDNKATQLLDADLSYRGKVVNGNDGRMSIETVQIGNDNVALQETAKSFGTHGIQQKMWIDQTGNNNYGSQYSKGGAGSVMTIKQVGNNNGNATDADVAAACFAAEFSNPLFSLFAGANGGFTQYQWGNGSTATIDITGNNNKTTQAQRYSFWATSGKNKATLKIDGTGGGDGNAVVQGQLGELNETYVDIYGDNNKASTSQEGDRNYAKIDVVLDGTGNAAAIKQNGDDNKGYIFQSGDFNCASILSNGDFHIGNISQTGNLNKAVITQNPL